MRTSMPSSLRAAPIQAAKPIAESPSLVKVPIRIQFRLITPRDPVSIAEDAFLALPEHVAMPVITFGPDFPFGFERCPQEDGGERRIVLNRIVPQAILLGRIATHSLVIHEGLSRYDSPVLRNRGALEHRSALIRR